MQSPQFAPHFCRGFIPIAFVFSAPGRHEAHEKKPVAGETGVNLASALEHLHNIKPCVFSSTNRYDYRITNAFDTPIAVSLGHRASEATNAQILAPANVQRVLSDLAGSDLVVLCGLKAQLLSAHVSDAGFIAFHASHTGNQALNRKYKISSDTALASPKSRRNQRAVLWATDLIALLDQHNSAR